MTWMTAVDWQHVMLPDTPFLEIAVRGSVVYLSLFALFRFVLKREAGTMGITDLLVLVLVADAAQNGMAGDYSSVADGLVLVGVLGFWAYLLDWLSYRFPWLERVVKSRPLPLVRDGRMLRRNMARELISEEELWTQLRLQGVKDLGEVEAANLEPDGRISVVRKDQQAESGADQAGGRRAV